MLPALWSSLSLAFPTSDETLVYFPCRVCLLLIAAVWRANSLVTARQVCRLHNPLGALSCSTKSQRRLSHSNLHLFIRCFVSFIAPFIVSVTPSLGRSLGEGLLYPRLALGAAASSDQLIFNLARPCVRASVGLAGRTRALVTPRNLVSSNWVIMWLTSPIILLST